MCESTVVSQSPCNRSDVVTGCNDCGASVMEASSEKSADSWNTRPIDSSEYSLKFMRGEKLLQRWAEGRSYDNYCEPADDGEYVLYGDHRLYVSQLENRIKELQDKLKALGE
jgi:hypothetical protein